MAAVRVVRHHSASHPSGVLNLTKPPTTLLVCALAGTAGTVTALPIFGGLPVFDGTAFAEMLVHTSKFVTQINQMVETYNRITQQYQHMVHQERRASIANASGNSLFFFRS